MKRRENKQELFKVIIDGNDSWAEIFQSTKDFVPLIFAIFTKHELKTGEVKNLTPGTNAVFRINDKVIKIFAPIESGFSTDHDFYVELASLQHANHVKITAPLLVCSGCIEDKYLFRYIVMDFINGYDAEHALLLYGERQKIDFAKKLKMVTDKMNVTIFDTEIPTLSIEDCLENKRWNDFPESFQMDRRTFIESNAFSECVYSHGDLTGENIIVDEDEEIYIIDFADSHLAPYYYEWSPIIFALFGCNPEMMEAYFGDFRNDVFYNTVTFSMLIHEFGATLLKQICDIVKVSMITMTDVPHVKKLLIESIQSGQMKVR